jgi:4-hydroxy-tetrahydrodipicolinate synthase
MWDAWAARDIDKFMSINKILYPLHDILFVETNPAPVKYALSKMGLCQNELRLPLAEVTPPSQEKIDAAMKEVAKAGYLKL